jgi:hypothetical protein
MITLRCTRRVLDNLKDPLTERLVPPTAALGEWYVNLIPVEIGHVFIFVHSTTLLMVALPAEEIRSFMPAFPERVYHLLRRLGISMKVVKEETRQMREAQIAKTASRSVLGSMNDIAFHVQYWAEFDEYGRLINLDEMEMKLSGMPHKPLGYRMPEEAVKDLLHQHYRDAFSLE